MSSSNAVVPVEQKTVIFYDDEIPAVLVDVEGKQQVLVPLRPICDFLGVDWSGQLQRIRRDPVLAEDVSGVVITPTPLANNKYSNPQEMACLPLDLLNGWLVGFLGSTSTASA